MSVKVYEAVKVYTASEVNLGSGAVAFTEDARGVRRVSMQAKWSNYTAVSVKLQASLDGVTYADVTGMAITTSGDIVSADIGPYMKIRVHVTATLSAGADSLEVWLQRSVL